MNDFASKFSLLLLSLLCIGFSFAGVGVALSQESGIERSAHNNIAQFARLVIVTNFQKAEVTVNGLAYPAFVENSDEEGMKLPAGGPHEVLVTFDGKSKYYDVFLRPGETRYLMVELSGYNGVAAPRASDTPAPAPRPASAPRPQPEKSDEAQQGEVTVYSRPRGEIMVNGRNMGQQTPGSVNVENGRHEVQVRYDDGEVSEKKIVRVRESSRIKLFFRQKRN